MNSLQAPFISLKLSDKSSNFSSRGGKTAWDLSCNRSSRVASLQFSKSTNKGDKATITLFDETSIELEAMFDVVGTESGAWLLNYGDWNNTANSSKVYTMTMTDFTTDFRPNGSTVTVEMVSTGSENLNKQSKPYEGLDIHEIVAKIAEEEGWAIGTIERCQTLYEQSQYEKGKKIKKIFYRWDKPALSFIKEDLIPYSVSSVDGSSNFQLTIDSTGSRPTVNYKAIRYNSQAQIIRNYRLDLDHGQYNMNGDRRTNIISFRPKYNGLTIAAKGAGTVSVATIDALTNERIEMAVNARNAGGSFAGSWTDVDPEIQRRLKIASASQEAMEKYTKYIWSKNATLAYEADLEVFGDASLVLNENINVLVFTKRGVMHHSSGEYRISTITDYINSGLYTTQMGLVRNSAPKGKFYIGE